METKNPNEQSVDLEAPLEGLISKPMHEMTEEELRAQVQKLHEYRVNSQSLYAEIRRSGGAASRVSEDAKKTKSLFEEFEV